MTRRQRLHFVATKVILRLSVLVGDRLGGERSAGAQRASYRVGHRAARGYLSRVLRRTLEETANGHARFQTGTTSTIWVAWWQGESQAPPIVRACLAQLRAAFGTERVTVVTGDNLREHCTLDEDMTEAFKDGRLSAAHFSDVVRLALLAQHGGVWLDATVWVTRFFDERQLEQPLVTVQQAKSSGRFVSDGRWAIYALGGTEVAALADVLYQMSRRYWQLHDKAIDYFLTDYLLDLAVHQDLAGARRLVSRPSLTQATGPHALRQALTDPSPSRSSNVRDLLAAPALYKLDWRLTADDAALVTALARGACASPEPRSAP